jgi:YHS domain-containing protein
MENSMIRILIWALLGYMVYLFFKGRSAKKEIKGEKPAGEETHCDPVCGVYVTEDDAVIGRLEGKRIFFCSMDCLEKFQERVTHNS